MAKTIQQYETPESRKAGWTGKTPDGHTWYRQVFHVPQEHSSIIPDEGDAYPGKTAADPAQLGPYVRSVKYGPRQVTGKGAVALMVIMEGRLLAAR